MIGGRCKYCALHGSALRSWYPVLDEVQDCVGIGSTAAVLRTLDRSSGLVVAVKITNSTETSMDKKIANEEAIYYRLICKPSPSLK